MKYLLTVLYNGREECLRRTLAAFQEHVTPQPSEVFIHVDGDHLWPALLPQKTHVHQELQPVGFTMGMKVCMEHAAQSDLHWFFHLEDDFVILRPLDLNHMRQVLELERQVKQMTLYRCPWGAEVEHGGYVNMHPGSYTRRETVFHARTHEWMETTRNYSTNPSLAATSFPREHPYPTVPQSEGIYGFEIREREPDATFGLWGWGEPWAAHIGVSRTASGFGY